MAIYVNFEKPKYLKDFLKMLFSYECSNFLTCVKTFQDELCTITQCPAGKFRSVDEILEIVNTYYPSIKIKTLCKILFNLKLNRNDDYNYKGYSTVCSTINRTVLLFTNFKNNDPSKKKVIVHGHRMNYIKCQKIKN